MIICSIDKIDVEAGQWLILVDHGCEGISVYGQYDSVESAVLNLANGYGSQQAIVYLPDIRFEVAK